MLRNLVRQYGIEGVFILVLLVSVMLSVYATVVVCLSIIVYMLASKKTSDVFQSIPSTVVWDIVAFCILALIVSIANNNQMGVYIALGVSVVVFIGMFMHRYMTRKLFEAGISLICWLSVACFGVALIQFFVYSGSDYRVPSTFMNANYYAMVIEFIVTLCLYKILSVRKRDARHILRYCFIILVNIAGLYVSGCRTGLIVTLSVILLMFLLYKRYSLFWIVVGALAVYVIAGLQYPGILVREDGLPNDFGNRLSIWMTTLKGIAAHPLFGGGGNSYAQIFAAFDGFKAVHAHNLILDILLNYGLVGFGLVLGSFIIMFRSIRKGATGTFHAQVRHVVYTACWCVLVHGLVDVTIFWVQTGLVFLFIFSGGVMREQYDFTGIQERRLTAGFGGQYLSSAGWPKSQSHRTEPHS